MSVTGRQEERHLFHVPEITPLTFSTIASMSAYQSIRHQSRNMIASVMCMPRSPHGPRFAADLRLTRVFLVQLRLCRGMVQPGRSHGETLKIAPSVHGARGEEENMRGSIGVQSFPLSAKMGFKNKNAAFFT